MGADAVTADWLFRGTVRTMDAARPRSHALAIRAGRVVALGDGAEALAGARTRVVELGERALLPGFHDAHVHLAAHGLELAQLDLRAAASPEALLTLVAERAATLEAGAWLLGSGFALERLGLARIGAAEADALERAAAGHPVALRSQDHHSLWGNRTALRLAGVTRETTDPAEGVIERDADGEPTGLLLERAMELLAPHLPEPDADELAAALARGGADLAARGVTTVHSMAFEPAAFWRATADAASREDYPVRVWACVDQQDIEHAAELGLATGQGGAQFSVGGAKFFADGALGSLTAWMLEPYAGRAGDVGVAVDGPEVLAQRLPLAVRAGLTPVVHAIGDAANRAVLDALEATAPQWRGVGLRPRIEHAQHLHPDDVPRFGALGVVASAQPLHLTFDVPTVLRTLPDRRGRAYPFASLLTAGAVVAFGSDTPVAEPDVLAALRAAVRREGVDGTVLEPAERLTLEQALRATTVGAAYAIGREGRSGRLAPGFDADLVVLSHDPDDGLDDLAVVATFKAGAPTFGEDALG
ncbi:MAG: amidohydrolase [Deinococcales bacterium]